MTSPVLQISILNICPSRSHLFLITLLPWHGCPDIGQPSVGSSPDRPSLQTLEPLVYGCASKSLSFPQGRLSSQVSLQPCHDTFFFFLSAVTTQGSYPLQRSSVLVPRLQASSFPPRPGRPFERAFAGSGESRALTATCAPHAPPQASKLGPPVATLECDATGETVEILPAFLDLDPVVFKLAEDFQ
ncbi:hypothetical protein BS50DRAFT_40120 [Corynespora cassiicola Philippines]|uniref:Uncharacterized protein n=1 Tax=Corynespora cassiicola Philippines TaxID=1448308 RepID=A0A2T2PCP7_CORCC|nr:hypothetical protein BS50DRAFT_40120 [Corynespora cassiicola Philippines]